MKANYKIIGETVHFGDGSTFSIWTLPDNVRVKLCVFGLAKFLSKKQDRKGALARLSLPPLSKVKFLYLRKALLALNYSHDDIDRIVSDKSERLLVTRDKAVKIKIMELRLEKLKSEDQP